MLAVGRTIFPRLLLRFQPDCGEVEGEAAQDGIATDRFRIVQALGNRHTLRVFRDDLDLSVEQAGDTVAWLIRSLPQLVAGLRRDGGSEEVPAGSAAVPFVGRSRKGRRQ